MHLAYASALKLEYAAHWWVHGTRLMKLLALVRNNRVRCV